MSIKRCAYKKCFSSSEDKSNTFFQFPKDPKRLEMWIKLSATENNKNQQKYLCAKHFDHSKYVASNPRRKLLLAHALPYQYEEDVDDCENDEEDEGDGGSINEEFEEIILMSDEVSSKRLKSNDSNENEQEYEFDEVIAQTSETDANGQEPCVYFMNADDFDACQKKFYSVLHSTDGQKQYSRNKNQLKISESAETANEEIEIGNSGVVASTLADEVSDEEIRIEAPHITTFIYKDQEYIQMRKVDYVSEKTELLKKLKFYKKIITNIKKDLNNLGI